MKITIKHIIPLLLLLNFSDFVSAICTANFQYNEMSPLEVQFQNTSESNDEGTVHYYWDFGDGSNSFAFNPINIYNSPGIYEVSLTIITTNLCYSQKIKEVYIGIPSSSPYCYLDIEFETINAMPPNYNNGVAKVVGYSNVPCCYYAFWSNGDEGEIIGGLSPGTYCVTLTDGIDCYGTSCVTIGYNDNCIASYQIDSTTYVHLDGAYRFVNNSHGEANYYEWDFGDGIISNTYNPVHVYADTGTYEVCLSIHTYYGCVSSVCKNLYVNYIAPAVVDLHGVVYAGETPLPQGVAVLYEYTQNQYDAIKYTFINDGDYSFDSLPKDKFYVIYVIPYFELDEVYFPKYTSTYYNNSLYWQQSNFINLYSDTLFTTNLYSYNNIYYGNGSISGSVEYLFNDAYEEEVFGRNWIEALSFRNGAAANMVVLLKNSFKEILDFKLTNGDGFFNFENLEYGMYYLSVEKPGFVSDELLIEVSESNREHANSDFVILQSTITAENSGVFAAENSVYPNPASDVIFVKCSSTKTDIRIYSVSGVCVYRAISNSMLTAISTEGISRGMYIIEVCNSDKSYRVKINIQ